jgi:hypothetical protein
MKENDLQLLDKYLEQAKKNLYAQQELEVVDEAETTKLISKDGCPKLKKYV